MDMTTKNAVVKKNFSQEDHWLSLMCIITMAKFMEAKWLVSGTDYTTEISQNMFLQNFI